MQKVRHRRRRGPVAGIFTTAALALGAVVPAGGDEHNHGPAAPVAPAAPVVAPVSSAAPAAPAADAHVPAPASVPADEAIQMLADGNARFVAGTSARPNLGQGRLCDTYANGQHPYAAVLACADSRVPVEHVLDAGIGDLFVVRVAGNVSDADEIGSLEYGVEHLGINAVLVLGHTKCGAVTAVVDKAHVTKSIAKLVDNIEPAADAARKAFPQLGGARLVHQAIRMNVRQSISDLTANSDLIRERVKDGRLKIVGGVYDLHSGEIDWLDNTAQVPATPVSYKTAPAPHAADKAPAPAAHKPESKPAAAVADTHHAPASHGAAKEHAGVDAAPAPTAAAAPEKKENFLALGGLLAGSSVATGLVLHFMGGSRRAAAASAMPAPAPASSAQ